MTIGLSYCTGVNVKCTSGWKVGSLNSISGTRQRASRGYGVVVQAKRNPIEAMNLDHGGSNIKRARQCGKLARLSTKAGRKVTARRKAKGRRVLFPGDYPRNHSGADRYTFRPMCGTGIVQDKDNYHYRRFGFMRVPAKKHKQFTDMMPMLLPVAGWENYMGRMRHMMELKHGLVPFYDERYNKSFYLKEQEEGDEARCEAEWADFKMSLEHHNQLEFGHVAM